MSTGNGAAAIGLANDNKLAPIGGLVPDSIDPQAGTSSYVGSDLDVFWDRNRIDEDVAGPFTIPSCNEGNELQWVTTGEDSLTVGVDGLVTVTDGVAVDDVNGNWKTYVTAGVVIPAGSYLWVEYFADIPPIEFNALDPISDQVPVVDTPFVLDVSTHFVDGPTPKAYTIHSGSLPPGLSLDGSTGQVTGTPTTPGNSGNVVFKGTDGRGHSANSNAVPFVTVNALAFSGPIPDQSWVEDSAITPWNISGYWSGGATPLVYSVFSGTLPAGLTLNASTGIISGTPTTPI